MLFRSGLIITGAPVEQMDFAQVAYWHELKEVLDWATTHVFSSLFICWAAQAALHAYYGIEKQPLEDKLFGVYPHRALLPTHPLMRGFDDTFYVPHSRHTTITEDSIRDCADLLLLATSKRAGFYLAASRNGSRVFATGHSEYDWDTLEKEYLRDLGKGLPIAPPENYYRDNDPENPPVVSWRAHANMLFSNWLNYFVYQETPFDLNAIGKR